VIWQPLPGRVIVTRVNQVRSSVLIIPDTYCDPRTPRTADRGIVLAAGAAPKGLVDELRAGDDVLYLGPADKLHLQWDGQDCYAVAYSEVLAVIE
jgi:co-chaperonin GroES (HSP10)